MFEHGGISLEKLNEAIDLMDCKTHFKTSFDFGDAEKITPLDFLFIKEPITSSCNDYARAWMLATMMIRNGAKRYWELCRHCDCKA